MNENERKEVFVKIKSIAQQWYDTGMAIESLKGLVQNDMNSEAIKTWDTDCEIISNMINDTFNSSKDDLSQIYKRVNSWKQ